MKEKGLYRSVIIFVAFFVFLVVIVGNHVIPMANAQPKSMILPANIVKSKPIRAMGPISSGFMILPTSMLTPTPKWKMGKQANNPEIRATT